MAKPDDHHGIYRTRVRKLVACATLMFLAPALAVAIDYPTKAVTIIVTVPPGGASDVQARLIAKGLSQRLGKPVVVESRSGAGGRIGAGAVARAKPDGHTLLLVDSFTLVLDAILHRNLGFDPQHDFAPVTLIAEMPLLLVASPSLGVKHVSELLALARREPGHLTYASSGPGSPGHLAGEMLKASAKIDLVHVPYKGAGPALIDVMGGQVSAGFLTPLSAMPNVRAGKVLALAVTGSKRLPALPAVPSLAESGVAGLDLLVWFGLVVPARTPPEVSTLLHQETVAVLRSREFAGSITDQGALVVASSPQELARRIQSDSASLAKVVKAIKFKVDE